MLPEFKCRTPVPDDVEYMLKTWGREIERTKPRLSDGRSAMPKRIFYNEFQKIMFALVQRSHARVIAPTSDPTLIANFTVANVYPEYASALVHFTYTRPPFRKLGLCKAALEDMGVQPGFEIVATHWTKYLNRFRIPHLLYNEYALYNVA